MDRFLIQKIDSDLKMLSYECDDLINKSPGVSEYYEFCKSYYRFLKLLNSIDWKNPEVINALSEFPAIQIPPLNSTSILIFTIFVLTGILFQSVFFFLFFIILPLIFLAIMIQRSVMKDSRKNLQKIILATTKLRSKIYT